VTRRLWAAVTELESDLRRQSRRSSGRLRPRLVPDISQSDLLFALVACLGSRRVEQEKRVLRAWTGGESGLVCLSVRSGFDLLLEALGLSPGDEVLVSAITHPDMVRILQVHGLQPIPVDLDAETVAPRSALLERVITPRTRAIVVAHLFGGRADLVPIAEVARTHGLLLIEDCAQSFRGPHDAGSPLADVSLFSFGATKTATALGGALVCVREPELLDRMRHLNDGRPLQSRGVYARRILKFIVLLQFARPRAYWLLGRTLELVGRDLDSFVGGAVRGFPGPMLASRIRKRPSAPLLALLDRRLRSFDWSRLERRRILGEYVTNRLPASVLHPGDAALDRTHWVFPVVVAEPKELLASLRRAGFDAATATSSIAAVVPPDDRPELAPGTAARVMRGVVFLPVYPELEEHEVKRLLDVVGEVHRNDD
jgi:perosamine synthetase